MLSLKHHFLRRADRSLNGASDRPLREIEAGEGFGGRLLPGMWSGGRENGSGRSEDLMGHWWVVGDKREKWYQRPKNGHDRISQ